MSSRPSVAIRLGTTGKAQVKADFDDIANSGDATARRWQRSFDSAGKDVEASMRRQALAAQKIAAIMPQTAVQMRIGDANGTGFGQYEGSARASAEAFRELLAEQARVEAGAAALRAQIDPTAAAQMRFNTEMREARTLVSAGAISLDEYCDKLRMERGLLEQSSQAHRRTGVSVGQLRAGTQQLSYQIGDVAQQFALGTPPMVVFAQQGGQVIQAVQMMTGSSKGLIGFLGGPWGAVITGGAMILGTLAAKYLDGSDAAKEKAASAKALTVEMDRLYDANTRAIKSEQRLQQETLNTAVEMWKKAESQRLATLEQIRSEKSRLSASLVTQSSGGGSVPGSMFSIGVGQEAGARKRLAELNRQEVEASKQVGRQWESVQAARIPILQGIASESDRATAASRRFDRSVDDLNKRFTQGKITGAEYTREHGRLKASYDAEQEALSKTTTKRRGLTDAQREARTAEREAIKDAREYTQDLQSLQDKYDPAAAAARRYREELEKIARLRGDDAAKADLYRAGAEREYRQSMIGTQIGDDVVKGLNAEKAARAQRAKDMLADQSDAMTIAERELALGAANDNFRDLQIRKLEVILNLKRQGIEEGSAEFQQIMSNVDAIDAMNAKIREQREAWATVTDVGGRFIDDMLNPDNWGNWGDAGKRILKSLLQDMLMLAAVNPLKNALFGSSLPTLGGVLGGLGGGGLSMPGAMNLTPGGASGGQMLTDLFGGSNLVIPGNAAGTHYSSGGAMLVGENGPEILNAPRGSQVTPAAQTRRMLEAAGGNVTVNQTVEITGGVDFANNAEVAAAMLQMKDVAVQQALAIVREQNRRAA